MSRKNGENDRVSVTEGKRVPRLAFTTAFTTLVVLALGALTARSRAPGGALVVRLVPLAARASFEIRRKIVFGKEYGKSG